MTQMQAVVFLSPDPLQIDVVDCNTIFEFSKIVYKNENLISFKPGF